MQSELRPRARRIAVHVVLVAFLAAPVVAQQRPAGDDSPRKADPSTRLLEAELLEVATGDLERALEVYRTLTSDDNTPDDIRARALLYTARCYRKQGKLDAAKKLLGELVTTLAERKPGERVVAPSVLRQARTFLAELRGAGAANPRFDWLGELARNPAIQERVFELAMELVSPESDRGKSARRQLLALGTLGVPVLEKVLETSRDALHRRAVAAALVEMGRFEHLQTVFANLSTRTSEETAPIQSLHSLAPRLSPTERRRFLAALDKVPTTETNSSWRLGLRVRFSEIDVLLADLESDEPRLTTDFSFRDRVGPFIRERRLAAALARRITDERFSVHLRETFYDRLSQSEHANLLGPPHYAARISIWAGPRGDRRFSANSYFQRLEAQGGFDELTAIAAGSGLAREALLNWIAGRFWPRDDVEDVAAGWGRVLRQAHATRGETGEPPGDPRGVRASSSVRRTMGRSRSTRAPSGTGAPLVILHDLAERHDSLIPEFADLLRQRASEAPEFLGHEKRQGGAWQPSTAYVDAMLGLLDVDDMVTRAIAVETLAHAGAHDVEAIDATLERLVREDSDPVVREYAIAALFKRCRERADLLPAVARALHDEWVRRAAWTDETAQYRRALNFGEFRSRSASSSKTTGGGGRGGKSQAIRDAAGSPNTAVRAGPSRAAPLYWCLDPLEYESRQALHVEILRHADSEAAVELAHTVLSRVPNQVVSPTVWEVVREPGSPHRDAALFSALTRNDANQKQAPSDALETFLRRIATDDSISVEDRVSVILSIEHAEANGNWPSWFDWRRLFAADDPLVAELFGRHVVTRDRATRIVSLIPPVLTWIAGLPQEESTPIWQAALTCSDSSARLRAVEELPFDRLDADFDALFARLSQDRNQSVRQALVTRLAKHPSRREARAFLHRLCADGQPNSVIQSIARYLVPSADADDIAVLTKLLDHSHSDVRKVALNALAEIRSRLEAEKLWAEFLEFRRQQEANAKKAGAKTPEADTP